MTAERYDAANRRSSNCGISPYLSGNYFTSIMSAACGPRDSGVSASRCAACAAMNYARYGETQSGVCLPFARHPWCRYHHDMRPDWLLHRAGLEQGAEIVRHACLLREDIQVPAAPSYGNMKASCASSAARTGIRCPIPASRSLVHVWQHQPGVPPPRPCSASRDAALVLRARRSRSAGCGPASAARAAAGI